MTQRHGHRTAHRLQARSVRRRRIVVNAVAASLVVSFAAMSAGQSSEPGKIDERVDRATGTTTTTVWFVLHDRDQPTPVNLSFQSIRSRRARSEGQDELRLEFYTGRLAAPDFEPPLLTLTIDGNTNLRQDVAAHVDEGVPLVGEVGILYLLVSADELRRIAVADRVEGVILGVEFALRRDQLQVIQEFAKRVLR